MHLTRNNILLYIRIENKYLLLNYFKLSYNIINIKFLTIILFILIITLFILNNIIIKDIYNTNNTSNLDINIFLSFNKLVNSLLHSL